MKYHMLIVITILMTMISSCVSQDEPIGQSGAVEQSPISVTRSSNSSEMLKFSSEAEFATFVTTLKALSSDNEKTEMVRQYSANFVSVNDIYWEAMAEAAEIDEFSESVYHKFSEKYNMMYFPEYEEDYGFYVAVKDLDLSFILNKDYEVEVGGKILNLRDVNDYETLMATGRAYYTNNAAASVATVESFTISSPSMNSVGPEYDSDWKEYGRRKVKMKARRRFVEYTPAVGFSGSRSLLHLEFCFRKKSFLGWVNFKCASTIVFRCNIPGLGWINPQTYTHNSMSSHDDELEYPVKITSDASHWYFTFGAAPCEASIDFNDISETLKYSWTMPAIQCVAPISASHYSIIPYY